MSFSILEETYKHSDSPFGDVTSNELSLTLFNDKGIFNPANTSSEYYGLIRKGVKIEAFIKPDEVTEWDQIGTYYVTDWYTSTSGATAEVTANDALHNVLNGPVPAFPVYRNIKFKDFMQLYFSYFNLSVDVDDSIDYTIPYVYTSEHSSNKDFITELMKSALADCFCDHAGVVNIVSKIRSREVRATLTDADQIINVTVKQSITTNYDSAVVPCNNSQESPEQTLVELNAMQLSPGLNSTGKLTLSSHPALSIRSLKVTSPENTDIASFNASAKEFTCSIRSTSNTQADLVVVGTLLDTIVSTVGDEGEVPLKVESRFIQEEKRAELIRNFAQKYVDANMPTLELIVRGNPTIQLGDIIEVSSEYYKIHYFGMVIKATYEGMGNLSCALTLINAADIREV